MKGHPASDYCDIRMMIVQGCPILTYSNYSAPCGWAVEYATSRPFDEFEYGQTLAYVQHISILWSESFLDVLVSFKLILHKLVRGGSSSGCT